MADLLTTVGGTAGVAGQFPPTNVKLVDWFTDNLKPELVVHQFAKKQKIGSRNSKTLETKKITRFTAVTAETTEGVTGDAYQPIITKATTTVKQYISYILRTDQFDETGMDATSMDFAKEQAFQAALTIDTLEILSLIAGTQVEYVNGSARTDLKYPMTKNAIRKAVRTLSTNNVPRVTKMSSGSPNSGTLPVKAAYIGLAHTHVIDDMRGLPGWQDVGSYMGHTQTYANEQGMLEGVRWVECTYLDPATTSTNDGGASATGSGMVSTAGTSNDVYLSIVMGRDAFLAVGINSDSAEMILKPLGSSGSADPGNQRASQAWKLYFAVMRLNEVAIQRIESCAAILN